MADAWGGAWGVSWGVSWGTGAPTPAPSVVLLGGKAYSFRLPYDDLKEAEYQRHKVEAQRAELKRIDEEIVQAEKRQQVARQRAQAKLAARNTARMQAALERELQELISGLRIERARLMRMIDDEEAILVLLLSLPLH